MSIAERILNGIRDVLRMQDKVKDLTDAIKDLSAAVDKQADRLNNVDRRLAHLEGMIEGVKMRTGMEQSPPAPPKQLPPSES